MKESSPSLVKTLSRWIARLPMGAQMLFGDIFGFLWFDVLRIRRDVALENIKRCFPDWPEEKRISVARASVCNIGRTFVEFMRIPSVTAVQWVGEFRIVGREHLEAALKKNKGVCLLTAHIGNGDWGTVGLALYGVHMHIISKEFKFAWLNRFWFETRESLGTEFIPDRQSSLTILKVLKKNGIVAFMLDQFMGPPIGVKTQFFGHETGTAMGLAVLAGRSGAAVLPTYTYRQADGKTAVVFEPEIPFVELENKDETIVQMTQKYCDKIEEWVRRHPEQWMWVHRRWKRFNDRHKSQLP
jgi:KDO2-lipid IV(A) lauroyltransferase